ncbi:MAG: glycosyltransferase 87 family protein [Mycobacteriales bacterium]|nr:glycosyltransferase 87 family protein [Mycobacteriales bacterium]
MTTERATTRAVGWPSAPALGAVALAVVLAAHGEPLGADRWLRALVLDHVPDRSQPLSALLSQLGSGAVLYPLLLLVAAMQRTWYAAAAPAALVFAQVLETVLLSALPRTPPGLVSWSGLSSGRTATAVLGWGLVALLLTSSRRAALSTGLAVGLLVATTRVVLDLHWLSDVVLALLVGATALAVCLAAEHRVPRRALPIADAQRWLRGSPWAWAVTVAAALVAVVPPLLEPMSRRLVDLAVYVGSAGVVGSGGDLYGYETEAGLPFTYPPFAALLAEPLSRIPLPLVQVLWTAASLVAAIAVAHLAMRPVVQRIGLPVTAALLLLSTPVRSHIRFGQVGLFLVVLVASDLLGRRRRVGWGVGLATAIKLTPGIYVVWLLVSARWTRLRATVLWAAGATAAGIVLLWQSSPTWLSSALWDSSRFGRNDIPGNQSVRGMLLRDFDDHATAERVWLPVAVGLVVIGVVGARRLELSGNRLAAVGTLAAASVAASPISWQHHLVWLTLPLAALVAADRTRLAAGWAALLVVPVTTMATRLDVPVVGALLVNTCGLTAAAATVLLPRLVTRRDREGTDHLVVAS